MVMKSSLHIAILIKLGLACEAMKESQRWYVVRKSSYSLAKSQLQQTVVCLNIVHSRGVKALHSSKGAQASRDRRDSTSRASLDESRPWHT
jgi:hypothetical protein